MRSQKSVLSVNFESLHNPRHLLEVSEQDYPRLREVPGLLEQIYVNDPDSGRLGGFFVFATESDREAFVASPLFGSLPERYAVRSQSLRLERYDVVTVLNESV